MKNTTENNRLINLFMGTAIVDKDGIHKEEDGYEYRSSWDLLMPVVEKIESLEYVDRMSRYVVNTLNFKENYTCTIHDLNEEEVVQCEGETRKIAVYCAVVEFVKWYNQQ